jgi:DNA topoisomerase I
VARLRRSDPSSPGITRRRRGKGFSYTWSNGQRVSDLATRRRIDDLVIPPAWNDVRICPWPNGHIQAAGTDDAGRRQYMYHEDWRLERDKEKFERAVDFGRELPRLRRRVTKDLRQEGFPKSRVVAAAVRLLDLGDFRVGNEEYAKEHETFGLVTLRKHHVHVHGDEIAFAYSAKGSIDRSLKVRNHDVAEVVSALRRRRGGSDNLFAWKHGRRWVDIHSDDVNEYIRTWAGTVYAAMALAEIGTREISPTKMKRAVAGAVKVVAQSLGNTPAVSRSAYIDPRILEHFGAGEATAGEQPKARRMAEKAVAELLDPEEAP